MDNQTAQNDTKQIQEKRLGVFPQATLHRDYETNAGLIIAIQSYALRLLEQGDVTPLEMSLWVSFRQACYRVPQEGDIAKKNIAYNDITGIANTSRTAFFRAISGKDEVAKGMVKRIPEIGDYTGNPHEDNATRWSVKMSPMLTRRDSATIDAFIAARVSVAADTKKAQYDSAYSALCDLTYTKTVSEVLDTGETIAVPENIPTNVVTILRRVLGIEGDIPTKLLNVAEALQDRIVSAYGTTIVSHHFFKVTAPALKLTQAQMWAIISWRNHRWYDYDTGEEFDVVLAPNGIFTLAKWGGTSVRNVSRWMKLPQMQLFLQELESEEFTRKTLYVMRGEDPALWFEEANDGTKTPHWTMPEGKKVDFGQSGHRGWTNRDFPNLLGQSGHRFQTKRSQVSDKAGLGFGQSGSTLKDSLSPSFKDLKDTTTLTNNTDDENLQNPESQKAGGGENLSFSKSKSEKPEWDLALLQKQNNASNHKTVNPTALVSWLLYAYSPEGEGIRNPYAFALSQLKDDPNKFASDPFAQLAKLGRDELLGKFTQFLQLGEIERGAGWKKFVRNVKRSRLVELAERLFDVDPEVFKVRVEYVPVEDVLRKEDTEKYAVIPPRQKRS